MTVGQEPWFNPRKDFLKYDKRLKTTYRYFGWNIASNIIKSFNNDKDNYKDFKDIPMHIYEVDNPDTIPGVAGFMPGQFSALMNLRQIKEVGENKDGIKTIMLLNIGTTIIYFYMQLIELKSLHIDIPDYIKSTEHLISDTKRLNGPGPHVKYLPAINRLFENFFDMIQDATNQCVTSLYDNREAIEKMYNFKLIDDLLPPLPISDIVQATLDIIDEYEEGLEDKDDIAV